MDLQQEHDHLPSPVLISDRVLINGVITPLTLTAEGQLNWTKSGRWKSTTEKEIMSFFMEGNKVRVKTLVERRGGGGGICYNVLVEVVNGLLKRADWRTALKLPIGMVPAGSGNGMIKSLLDLFVCISFEEETDHEETSLVNIIVEEEFKFVVHLSFVKRLVIDLCCLASRRV